MSAGKRNVKRRSVVLAGLSCAGAAALGVGNYFAQTYSSIISGFFNQETYKVVSTEGSEDTEYFKSEFASDDDLSAASSDLGRELEAEGMVLLQNDDNALPLASGSKVSLFSESSVDMIYGGTGSGAIDTSSVQNLREVMEESGFVVNPTLWEFYEGNHENYQRVLPSNLPNVDHAYQVNECPVSEYTDDVKASYASYGDAAIVVLSRSGGEGLDLITDSSAPDGNYLAITDEEQQIFDMLESEAAFNKVVVLLNTSNPMELGFTKEYSKVKATLWVGNLGQVGISEVPRALVGEINPSGRLVDTYAADAFSAPAMANFGESNVFTNRDEVPELGGLYGNEPGNIYVTYAEGIYVGYRYFETRYEDVVLGQGNAGDFDYAKQVIYPFGYGLSYTQFELSGFSMSKVDGGFEATITVTNTGEVAGKNVVQLYMQSPYTDYDCENGVEKSAIELVGFAKTSELAAGQSETVTIEVSEDALKSYDASKAKTYIVDEGDYYFAAGDNVHEALNNILAAKGYAASDGMTSDGDASFAWKHSVSALDSSTYATSSTGMAITNAFDTADPNYYDGAVEGGSFAYLTRSDWEGTFPKQVVLTATAQMIEEMTELGMEDDPSATMPTTGADNGLQLIDMRELEYDDPAWDDLLDELTPEEMDEMVRIGGYATAAAPSVGKPASVDRDGPQGISGTIGTTTGVGLQTVSYCGEILMASSWNRELLRRVGEIVGESGLHLGITGWYAPGMNIHRAPFSGRNFEYYSEDPMLSAALAAEEVAGAQSKGIFCFIKHFALNDQDAHRYGISTYSNEQAIREIYLPSFESAISKGGATALMTSYNRIGTKWSAAHKGLITTVLRGEWGFKGVVLTDWASMEYMDLGLGLSAGNDQWLNTNADLYAIDGYQSNATVMSAMREASHHILYTASKSALMNGLSSNSRVEKVTPMWQYALYGLDIAVGALAIGSVANVVRQATKKDDVDDSSAENEAKE